MLESRYCSLWFNWLIIWSFVSWASRSLLGFMKSFLLFLLVDDLIIGKSKDVVMGVWRSSHLECSLGNPVDGSPYRTSLLKVDYGCLMPASPSASLFLRGPWVYYLLTLLSPLNKEKSAGSLICFICFDCKSLLLRDRRNMLGSLSHCIVDR